MFPIRISPSGPEHAVLLIRGFKLYFGLVISVSDNYLRDGRIGRAAYSALMAIDSWRSKRTFDVSLIKVISLYLTTMTVSES